MKSEDTEALISYRMERSVESMKAAEIMLEEGMLSFSMNRVYYAMFYAVQSLLSLDRVSFSKHGQLKGYFNRQFINKGIFPIEMGRLYNQIFEYRQKFDYVDFAVPDREMVSEYIKKTKGFCAKVDEYIQTRLKTSAD